MRGVQEPTTDKWGAEVHPAFGMINGHRVSATPGQVLFDSELKHNHYVVLTISRASRKRDLNRDWIHPGEELIEVAMSEAQWASFISSMNTTGSPCTITRTEDEYQVPMLPYQPRLAESMAEVKGAAEDAMSSVVAAFEEYKAHKTVGNLRHLESAIANIPSNMQFAAKSLVEHTENVVQKAKADIEAMVTAQAERLGISAGDIGTLELTQGE